MSRVKHFFAKLFVRKPKNSPSERGAGAPRRPQGPDTNQHRQPTDVTFKKGDLIGGAYEIYKLLGKGGFGEVYLACHRESGSACALKTIRADLLAHTESRNAFKREALLWVSLEQHPFILSARIVHEFSRRLFVGMDYIAPDALGRVSLADHFSGVHGPLDADDCIKWAIQFCHGMEHALQRGIKCHRDIKPTNILITQDGTLKISDFGLALAAQAAWKEKTGSLVTGKNGGSFGLSLLQANGKRVCGTPGYIAPELFLGRDADVRSDIYSFGLVLWQMAKRSPLPPFHIPYERARSIEGYLRAVFEQQTKGHVPPVGGPMQSAIERCLAFEPSRRYASFEGLRGELELIFRRRTGRVVELSEDGDRTAVLWNNRGISLGALGRHEEAIACYAKALEIDPRDFNAWNNKGTAFGALGRDEHAIDCFQRALEIDPQSAVAWNNKGNALDTLGRHEQAVACFNRALEIDPHRAVVWDGKGVALGALGRHEEAIACFTKALEFDPKSAAVWNNRGKALYAITRHEEALACFAEAARIDPRDASAWNNKGTVLGTLGRLEEAVSCFDKALGIDPHFAAASDNKRKALEIAHSVPEIRDEDIPL
jgi:serine/threonine protein kinase